MRTKLEHAILMAVQSHCGQKDKSGEPYILHCLRVMSAGETEEERIVGVLHDVVEDTGLTVEVVMSNFGPVIGNAVAAISKVPGERNDYYIERVLNNPLATRVKLHDLRDNMNERRMRNLDTATYLRLKAKYERALAQINAALNKEV